MLLLLALAAALVPVSRARADPPVFGIPFGCGLTFHVSQTHNTGSHEGNDTWAWDFRMPVGTPVVAAEAGVVRMARGDSTQGGCDPAFAKDANYVVIDHPGGYETQYLHFSRVVVSAGEQVKQGQLLGYSGETGWACGAHLHFKVALHSGPGWNNPSIPARLAGYGDPPLESLVAAPLCKAPETTTAARAHALIHLARAEDVKKAPPEKAKTTQAPVPAKAVHRGLPAVLAKPPGAPATSP